MTASTLASATSTRRRHALVLLLAANSGAIDAIGFVALGGAFTSVMTGNLILLGISVGTNDGALGIRSGLALVCFVLGAHLGGRIARNPAVRDPVWPRQVALAMRVELALLVCFSVGWWLVGGDPKGNVQPVLLGIEAVALGVQSSAVLRFGVSGLSTTYMTGTLTTMVSALANGEHPRNVLPSVQILLSLIGGAVVATLLARHATMAVPALQLIPVTCAVVLGRWR